MEKWKNVKTKKWKNGKMEKRKNGKTKKWKNEKMEKRKSILLNFSFFFFFFDWCRWLDRDVEFIWWL